jgi:PBP1b-binding outer membrane lipoprotein LpoB
MARSVSERRLIVVLICSLILMGCRDKNDQQASAEAAEATTSLSKTRSDLTKACSQGYPGRA